jgi:hypothetical protein
MEKLMVKSKLKAVHFLKLTRPRSFERCPAIAFSRIEFSIAGEKNPKKVCRENAQR